MGRQPCCDKVGLKKGPWTAEEDKKLINFMFNNGQCCWRALPKLAGLLRCGKSCRLRWTNYLRPDLKRGLLSEYEENIVIDLHAQLGNRWSKIASHFPGRTDNEIKNHWNTHIKKKLKKMGIDPLTHQPLPTATDDHPPPPPSLPLSPPPQQPQEAQQEPTSSSCGTFNMDQSKESTEFETSTLSTITEAKEQDKIIATSFDSMEVINNGFCTDEVPLIEPPHEILVPYDHPPSTSSSSSSSYSFTSYGGSSSNILEDLEFLPDFGWLCDDTSIMGLWDDDYIILDRLINGNSDWNLAVEGPNHSLT